MAQVTGFVTDFGRREMYSASTEIHFIPNRPGMRQIENLILSARPIISPVAIYTGFFTVELAANDRVIGDDSWYDVVIVYRNGVGVPIGFDEIPHRLYVTQAGGNITDLLQAVPGPMQVFWQPAEPSPWPVGAIWVSTITGLVQRRKA